jgi:hypothetical protein
MTMVERDGDSGRGLEEDDGVGGAGVEAGDRLRNVREGTGGTIGPSVRLITGVRVWVKSKGIDTEV